MKINIVLVEPEIPQNTGNIARTCAAIGAKLHLVKPLGFSISDKQVKRARLDYWDKLEIEEHDSLTEFLEKNPNVNEVHLHLDRDLAGRNASTFFQQVLSKKYKVFDRPMPYGKDVNEYLCLKKGIKKIEKERTR